MTDQELIQTAHYLADESRKIVKKYFRNNTTIEVQIKDNSSLVTAADEQIERMVREVVASKYKDHGILGEEEEDTKLDADYVWVVDPIDGTNSFILGRPLFATLIGLFYKGKAILGLIDQAITGERWFAYKDQQTTFNGSPVSTSNVKNLSDSKILLSSPELFAKDNKPLEKLYSESKLLAWETEAYGYGLLSMGSIDAVIKPGLDPYDYLPVVKIIENAGGIIKGRHNRELTLDYVGDVIAASTIELFNKISEIY